VGYQGFIVSYDFNFYLQPTCFEIEAGVLPDQIAVVGRQLVGPVKRYCSALDVMTAPAFRFAEIHKKQLEKSAVQEGEFPSVLVPLPISVKDSIDIIRLLVEAIEMDTLQGVLFLIKPHPNLNISKLKSAGPDWPDSFEVINGSFAEILKRSSLMVGNTSSTCMEALAYGVPVVIIGSHAGITQNPIPHSVPDTIWNLCYTADEVRSAINRFCFALTNQEKQSLSSLAEVIKGNYFEPVTKGTVGRFFKQAKLLSAQ